MKSKTSDTKFTNQGPETDTNGNRKKAWHRYTRTHNRVFQNKKENTTKMKQTIKYQYIKTLLYNMYMEGFVCKREIST